MTRTKETLELDVAKKRKSFWTYPVANSLGTLAHIKHQSDPDTRLYGDHEDNGGFASRVAVVGRPRSLPMINIQFSPDSDKMTW